MPFPAGNRTELPNLCVPGESINLAHLRRYEPKDRAKDVAAALIGPKFMTRSEARRARPLCERQVDQTRHTPWVSGSLLQRGENLRLWKAVGEIGKCLAVPF